MRTVLKFNYLFKPVSEGSIKSNTWTLEEIQHGAVEQFLKQLKTYYTIAHREFTGKLDKHGKEIYDSDIIKVPVNKGCKGQYEVIFDEDNGCWDLDRFDDYGFDDFTAWQYAENFEVIGNIYDNPQLMEE